MAISVLVADDHPMIRSGLDGLFSGTEVSVIAVASNTKDAVAETVAKQPDVVLLDVRMNENSGLDALEEIKQLQPQIPVVILSTYDNPTYVARAHALGACDYVTKGTSRDDLVRVVKAAANGESPIEAGLLYNIAATLESKKGAGDDIALTNRESQGFTTYRLGVEQP